MKLGSSTVTGLSLMNRISTSMFSLRKSRASPTSSAESEIWSYVSRSMKWKRSSWYRYCIRFSSKSTSSTFSPARNVLSITRPSRMCLSLVRTKAPPLPGFTCWKSTMLYGSPSNWIFSPFLNSAVDTCIRSQPFPSLSLESERLLEAFPGPCVAQVSTEESQEDLRGLVHQSLLQTERAEAQRGECVVGQDLLERRAVRHRPAGAEHVEEGPGFPVARVQSYRLLQMTDRIPQRASTAVQISGQPVRLRFAWARLEDGLNLLHGAIRIAPVEERLGEDQTRGDVVREPREPLPAQPNRVGDPPRLAIRIGQGSKRQRRGIPG